MFNDEKRKKQENYMMKKLYQQLLSKETKVDKCI